MSEFANSNEINLMKGAIARAAEAVTGDPTANPLEVFPNPRDKERRADVQFGIDLSAEQEALFRSTMAEFGPGREGNTTVDTSRLSNELSFRYNPDHRPERFEYKALLDGGQYHKMRAELETVLGAELRPSMIIATGSAGRILPPDERTLTAKLLNVDESALGVSEYDVAQQMFTEHPSFAPWEDEFINGPSNAQYDLSKDPKSNRLIPYTPGFDRQEQAGQFKPLGSIYGIPVVLMRIDRYPDPAHPEDPSRYIQPNNSQKITIAAGLRASNEYDNNMVFVTSATYEPSAVLAAHDALEGFDARLTAQVISYGIIQLAKVKGESPVQPSVDQLAAEAYKVAEMLQNR